MWLFRDIVFHPEYSNSEGIKELRESNELLVDLEKLNIYEEEYNEMKTFFKDILDYSDDIIKKIERLIIIWKEIKRHKFGVGYNLFEEGQIKKIQGTFPKFEPSEKMIAKYL